MTPPPIAQHLVSAYLSWSITGVSRVPEFRVEDYERAYLEDVLADLDAVAKQCVISKTQADWLRKAIA